jgi:Spy/CpxP family protein refolding chaperone
MRRINIAACSLMLLAAASAPVMAQGNMGGGRMDPAQMVQRSTTRLLTGITLTAAQTDSVKAINDRLATAAKAETGGDMRAKMTEMRTNQRTQLRAVLTPDQQTVFDKNVADMDKARMNRPQP